MKQFFKSRWEMVVLVLLNILVYSPWFFSTKYITFSDFRLWLLPTQKELLLNSFLIYRSNTGLGNIALGAPYHLMEFLYGVFATFEIDYRIAVRVLLLWPLVLVTPIFAYKLALKIVDSRLAAVVSTVIVLFNTYSLILINGGSLIAIADTLLIVFFYYTYSFFAEGYKRNDLIKLILTGIFLGVFEFRIFYIGLWVSSIFIVFWFFVYNKSIKEKLKASLLWVWAIVLILMLNLAWIIPFYLTKTLTQHDALSRGLFGEGYFDLPSAMTLFHRFWNGTAIVPFINQPIPHYFWLIPIFAFAGLYVNRKNKIVLFFGIISLLGIFLTKMSAMPFPGSYLWLYEYLPGFNAFREASKFYIVTILGYSILIGSFVSWLWKQELKTKWRIAGASLITFLIAGIFLFNTKPFFTKEIMGLLIVKNMPDEYRVLNDFLLKDKEFFRTYWIPVDSRWGVYTDMHPKISGVELADTKWQQFQTNNNSYGRSLKDQALDVFLHNYSDDLFDDASIKYVIVPLQDIANDDDFYFHFRVGEKYFGKEYFVEMMDTINFLKRIEIGTKDIVVYENINYKPHISTTDTLFVLDTLKNLDAKYRLIKKAEKDFNFILTNSVRAKLKDVINARNDSEGSLMQKPSKISFEVVNVTKKIVRVKGASKPFFLHMNTTYDPQWKLIFNNEKMNFWYEQFPPFSQSNQINDEDHYTLNNLYNGWYVNTDEHCTIKQLCKKNSDGSYDMEMIIEFWPQRLYNLGLFLSGLVLVGMIIFFFKGFIRIRRRPQV